jgi:hypothetical protein
MRGEVFDIFYSRYAPAAGWTTPLQVDGDDGHTLGAIQLALRE